jgi:hypothetical protein
MEQILQKISEVEEWRDYTHKRGLI